MTKRLTAKDRATLNRLAHVPRGTLTPKQRLDLGLVERARRRERKRLDVSSVSKDARWYALTTDPQKEIVAEQMLIAAGFNAFCPDQRVARRGSRRERNKTVQFIDRAMLTSMVLFAFDGVVPWLHVFEVARVTGVVCVGGVPAALNRDAVLDLLGRSGAGAARRAGDDVPAFNVGDSVRSMVGPFTGIEGEVIKSTEQGFVVQLKLAGLLGDASNGEVVFEESALQMAG